MSDWPQSWDRTEIDFINTRLMAWTPLTAGLGGRAGEGRARILGRQAKGGAHTALLAFRAPQCGVLACSADILVVTGHGLHNADVTYRAGDYLHVPAGAWIDLRPTGGETLLYAAFDGENQLTSGLEADDVPVVTHRPVNTRQWTSMSWRGSQSEADGPGARIQWLRQDEDCIVFLVAMLPGWRSELEEKHPVFEESYKIAGDLLMGKLGVVKAGGYFYRHPETWHGPLYSRSGSLSIIRKNGLGSTEYRDPTAGTVDELIDRHYGFGAAFADQAQL